MIIIDMIFVIVIVSIVYRYVREEKEKISNGT